MIGDLFKSIFIGPIWFRCLSGFLLILVISWLYLGIRINRKVDLVNLSACSIDASFLFDESLDKHIDSVLQNSHAGIKVIADIYTDASKHGSDDTRLLIASKWSPDQFIESFHKPLAYLDRNTKKITIRFQKPLIEYSQNAIEFNKEYNIEISAFPNFGIHLKPEYINFRHNNGLITSVTDFASSSPGWYSAKLLFKQ